MDSNQKSYVSSCAELSCVSRREPLNKSRRPDLDVLRVIAIFFVIFNHSPGFFFPEQETPFLSYWFSLFFMVATKSAVPFFFIITGALLLNKEESLSTIFTKRLLRYVIVIVLYLLVQLCWMMFRDGISVATICSDLTGLFKRIYYGGGCFTSNQGYWFLWVYVEILLFLPVLRSLARSMPDRIYIYLFVLQLVLCLFFKDSVLYSYSPFRGSPHHLGFGYAIYYVLLGYFLEHRLPAIASKYRHFTRSMFVILVMALIVAVLGMEITRIVRNDNLVKVTYSFYTALLPIICSCSYGVLRCFFSRWRSPAWVNRIISSMGGAVFFVFLTENIYREILQYVIPAEGKFYLSIFIALLTLITGLAVGICLRQFAIVRRWI